MGYEHLSINNPRIEADSVNNRAKDVDNHATMSTFAMQVVKK